MNKRELISQVDESALFIDGQDDAIVGIGERCGQPTMVVYDRNLLHAGFVAQGMTEEEASEWIDYNIAGAWIGPNTPLLLTKLEDM
jgi:hypothetical protein